MNNYLIFTDSAVDMPQHYFEEYDLRVIPMQYTLNGKDYICHNESPDHDQRCDELFAALRKGGDIHTSQITPFNFTEIWRPLLEAGNDILHISFSSGLSATAENATIAAIELHEEFPDRKMIVVDSLSATQGQGVFVIAALKNRASGMSIEENAEWLKEKAIYICHRFMVGDLNYLHKGGRVSKTVAIIGSALQIKPILIINDEGKLDVVAKARGEKQAIKKLVSGYAKEQGVPDVPKHVIIGHTSLYEQAEEIKKMIEDVAEEGTIVETANLGPIIGAHIGPSFFSICGWGFHRLESK